MQIQTNLNRFCLDGIWIRILDTSFHATQMFSGRWKSIDDITKLLKITKKCFSGEKEKAIELNNLK